MSNCLDLMASPGTYRAGLLWEVMGVFFDSPGCLHQGLPFWAPFKCLLKLYGWEAGNTWSFISTRMF